MRSSFRQEACGVFLCKWGIGGGVQIYTTRLMIVNREENLNVNNTVLCKCITFVSVDEINRNMEFIALILFVWLIV